MINVSFSGGRSSALMLKILLENYNKDDLIITFANTGKERPETLDFVNDCAKHFGCDIIWVEAFVYPKQHLIGLKHTHRGRLGFRIRTYETASRNGEPFAEIIEAFGVPNRMVRFCTEYLKRVPIYQYLKSRGLEDVDYKTAMGIRADEKHRARKFSKQDFVFPLIDMMVSEQDVRNYWQNMPFDLQLKDYQGNCDLCHLKSLKKRKTILKESPILADWWIEQERKTGSQFDGTCKVENILRLSKNKFVLAMDKQDARSGQIEIFPKDLGDISCYCGD